jgi:hypothetical protein
MLVRLSISSNVDFLKPVAFLGQIIFRVNAPRAPLATVKLQFHRQRGIKRVATAQSTGMPLILATVVAAKVAGEDAIDDMRRRSLQ